MSRLLVSAAGLCAAGIAVAGYAALVEPNRLTVTRPSLPRPVPVRTVFFSDLHIGRKYSPAHLEPIVDAINRLHPQLVLFGGDFFAKLPTDRPVLDFDWIAAQLRRIEAPLGKYAVAGNHDVRHNSLPEFYRLLKAGSFNVLWEQTAQPLPGLEICGLAPYTHGDALRRTDSSAYRICLCHMPDKARYLPLWRCDLMLSGHSHAGQIRLPVLTGQILPPGGKYYHYGLYQPQGKDRAALFVSRGLGVYGPPMRLAAPPEIVLL